MDKKPNKFKNNKKFWKWVASSLFLIVFGISATINIAYLPKYFALKNNQETSNSQVLNVNISATGKLGDKEISFSYTYQTIFPILGDLMASASDTYTLKQYSFGRMLIAVTDHGVTIQQTENYYWSILRNGTPTSGIDLTKLNSGDKVELRYTM